MWRSAGWLRPLRSWRCRAPGAAPQRVWGAPRAGGTACARRACAASRAGSGRTPRPRAPRPRTTAPAPHRNPRALAGDHAVLPPVPGAHHEFRAHPALAQRSPPVITDVGDSGETAFVQKHGDLMPLDLEGEGDAREQLVARSEAVPGGHGRSREAWRSRTYRPSYAAEPSVGFITPGARGAG